MNTSTDLYISVPYAQFLQEAKARIAAAQAHVARSMNTGVIGLYWDLGKLIVEKQSLHGWGDSVVRLLAKDLTRDLHAGKSFSARNLWFMRQMYLEYSQSENSGKVKQAVSLSFQTKMKQLVSQIPWGQNIAILQKVKSFDARVWYLEATARYGWSRNILLNQIKTNAYSRNVLEKKSHNFHSVLPPKLANNAQEALKGEYNLEFLGIRNEIQEMELESRLIERLRDFILELGYGFCFIGRQHRLVLNAKEYFIDLLFLPSIFESFDCYRTENRTI
jgi:predicted nuclease of restriction endonuclease-like (RecB) superfamily